MNFVNLLYHLTWLFAQLFQTESEVIVSRLSIPRTNFELQYLRPDFIMLRVIARNLIMWSRFDATEESFDLEN